MAMSSDSNHNDEPEKSALRDDEADCIRRMGWESLFSFTTKKHLPVFLVALLGATVAALTLPALAIVYGLIFREYADFGAGRKSAAAFLSGTSRYCIYLVAFGGLSWLANSIYFMFFLIFGELQAKSARTRIFNALLKKNMTWYDTQETGISAILPAVQSQIRDLQLSVSQPFGEVLQCIIQAIGALGVAFYSSWDLTLVTICTVPITYLIMAWLSTLLSKRAHEQSDTLQEALKYVTNVIRNIETVKCFNGERFEFQRYASVIARAGSLYSSQAQVRSLQLGFMQFFTLSIFVQGFWYGSHLILNGERNSAQIMTTFWAAMMAVQGVTAFMPQFIVLQKGKVAGARLRALVSQTSKDDVLVEGGGQLKPERCFGHIQLKKVSFSYPSRMDQVALDKVSLSFPAGKTTFVIGRSGSGKSTLGQLLVRFYQPTSGEVTLDGTLLEKLDVHWLRDHITLVEQHSVLFNESIRRNISLGKKDYNITKEDVEQAVTFAMLRQMVQDLPNGLETDLGMTGNSLSGGQRQRVALARARLRDTPVLILDESTSALDYITRSAIIGAIRSWRRGKTTIIITHDISQIDADDFVYVMDHAQVVEQGFRKMMEIEPHSAFYTFVNSNQTEVPNVEDCPIDDTEEIFSLYADSWGIAGQLEDYSSTTLFRQSLSIPFSSPRRPSLAISFRTISRKPSIESEIGNGLSDVRKPRPVPASAPGTFGEKEPVERIYPASIASSHSSRRGSPALRPLSTLRPLSFASPTLPSQTENDNSPSFRKTFRAKMELRRKRQSNNEHCEDTVENLSILHIIRSVWPLVGWTSRFALIIAIFCALVHAAATPAFGFVLSSLFSTFFIIENQRELAQIYSLSILGIAVVDGLAVYGFEALFDICAQRWANVLKSEGMKRILLQPREFFDRKENSVSRLAECLDNFAEEARNLPGRFTGILIVMVLTVTIALIWSMITCWKLTLMALACLSAMFCITRVYNTISNRWERLCNEADERVGQVLHETFVNIRTVRCLVLEEVFRQKYTEATLNALKTGTKRSLYSGSMFGLNYSSAAFVSALLFWWGAYIVSKGEFTATNIIMTFNILMLSVAHANHIGSYIPQINIARDAGSRLMRLARLPQDSHELIGTEQLFIAGDIALEHATFTYPTRLDHPVLYDVTLNIPQGSCTAIVGTSGSGKSTIAALLLKLYPTDQQPSKRKPDISISNHDIKGLHTFTIRSRIALVSQTPVIFPGTIAENITYGLSPSSPFTTTEDIHAAAAAAGVDEFIDSLPQGYRTVVGDGGTGLSGGQAQRIAIARAIVRKPDILILDEATSALDVESAGIIRDTVQRLVRESKEEGVPRVGPSRISHAGQRKHMTVIIITHAREMMAIAERIIMLEKGRVVDEGSFKELKRKRGPFASLLRGDNGERP